MDYAELLARRRSVRDYEEREMPPETVVQMIGESCLAPSSSNRQPWHFVIVVDRAVIRRVSDDSKRVLVQHIERDPGFMGGRYEAMLRDPDFNVFYNAPCLVLIAGPNGLRTLDVDCALAASYLMFAASARGLATCWVGLGRHFDDPELRTLLGLPEGDRVVAPIVVGYPRAVPAPPRRTGPEILRIVE